MGDNKWHWQERGTAWKGVGIYHVTLTVPSREPLLGKLVIPENDPKKAVVERTEMGKEIVHTIFHIQDIHPDVRVLQFCIMPDHIHVILYVTRTMNVGIKTVVRGWWQGVKKVSALSIDSNNIRDNQQSLSYIFTEIPFIRPLSRHGQLDTMFHYIRMNPQRLATKRLMPEYFRVQEGIEIAGRMYCGVGNAELLQRAKYMPVHVRRTMVEEAEHGYDQRLRDYMNGCVLAARKGIVMVSPFISPKEKEVMRCYSKRACLSSI